MPSWWVFLRGWNAKCGERFRQYAVPNLRNVPRSAHAHLLKCWDFSSISPRGQPSMPIPADPHAIEPIARACANSALVKRIKRVH